MHIENVASKFHSTTLDDSLRIVWRIYRCDDRLPTSSNIAQFDMCLAQDECHQVVDTRALTTLKLRLSAPVICVVLALLLFVHTVISMVFRRSVEPVDCREGLLRPLPEPYGLLPGLVYRQVSWKINHRTIENCRSRERRPSACLRLYHSSH